MSAKYWVLIAILSTSFAAYGGLVAVQPVKFVLPALQGALGSVGKGVGLALQSVQFPAEFG